MLSIASELITAALAIASPSSPATSRLEMGAVADDEPASDDHVAHVGGGRGEDH